mgnify:CR=1 FL=1
MVRTVDRKISVWLAGYYDDFSSSRVIPDNKNDPASIAAWSHTNTHHGNPLNGEAPLNPNFAFSLPERAYGFNRETGSTTEVAKGQDFRDSKKIGMLQNDGIHEWITKDRNRISMGQEWEGKRNDGRPNSVTNANRWRFRTLTAIQATLGETNYGYMWMTTSMGSGTKYWTFHPCDGSEGRGHSVPYAKAGTGTLDNAGQCIPDTGSNTVGVDIVHTYLASTYSWEWVVAPRESGTGNNEITADTGEAITTEKRMTDQYMRLKGHDIISPSKMPFLVSDARFYTNYGSGSASYHTLMLYDGSLNARGDKDTFHIRIHPQLYLANTGGGTQKFLLKAGFNEADVSVAAPTGVTDTMSGMERGTDGNEYPAVSIEFDWADLGLEYSYVEDEYNSYAGNMKGRTSSTLAVSTLTDAQKKALWKDIDIVLDFTNQRYTAYIDGVAMASYTNTAFGNKRAGSVTWLASDFYGWALQAYANLTDERPQVVTLIDRVGLIHPVTDHISWANPDDTTIGKIGTSMSTNSLSSINLVINDTGNNINFGKIVMSDSQQDWKVLVFRNSIDRPILRGTMGEVKLSQDEYGQSREIDMRVIDDYNTLNRQLPVWEVGQAGFGDNAVANARRGLSEALMDKMYLGAVRLKLGSERIGWDYDTADTDWFDDVNSRLQLYSGNPIQLYHNEDDYGPNYVERPWNYRKVRGFSPGSAGNRVAVNLPTHGFSASDSVTITGTKWGGNTGYDGTHTITALVNDADGNSGNVFEIAGTWEHNAQIGDYYKTVWNNTTATATTNVLSFYTLSTDTPPPSSMYQGFVTMEDTTGKAGNHAYWNSSGLEIFRYDSFIHIKEDTQTDYGKTYFQTRWPWALTGDESHPTLSASQMKVSWTRGWVCKTNAAGPTETTPVNFPKVKNRVNHAVWMRDLPKSKWFQKMFGRIKEQPLASYNNNGTTPNRTDLAYGVLYDAPTTASTTLTINKDMDDLSAAEEAAIKAGGVGEVWNSYGQKDSFCFSGATDVSNRTRLDGVKFLSVPHKVGESVYIRDIDDDYKHIWVLWADMRNDGNADADNSERKNKFGLIYPTTDNYTLSLHFVDQQTIDSETPQFVELKIGEECDIWEIDAEAEPFTGASWSSLGSDSLPHTHHKNWEDKAGSFIIIDFSKFFNLNTESNGGAVRQMSGGNKTLGEYVTDSEGHPALMDDYWQEALASPNNMPQNPDLWQTNWEDFFHVGTSLGSNTVSGSSGSHVVTNIEVGDSTIYVNDTSQFPNQGLGFVSGIRSGIGGAENEIIYYILAWFDKDDTINALHHVTIREMDLTAYTVEELQDFTTQVTSTWWQHGGAASAATSGVSIGSEEQIRFNTDITLPIVDDGFETIDVYSGFSTPYALRFMMALNGHIESTNCGTWYQHEKMKLLQALSTAEFYYKQFNAPFVFDINNMPITRRMTTTQLPLQGSSVHLDYDLGNTGATNVTREWDDYGSVLDVRGKTALVVVKEIAQQIRAGSAGTNTIFTWMTGRDGRLDLRPSYTSGFVYNRNNLKVSQLNTMQTTRVSHVRAYYNGGASFADYPATTINSKDNRWKILELQSVKSHSEALQLAKAEYDKQKAARFAVKAQVVQDIDEDEIMLYKARYGYVADTFVRTVNPDQFNETTRGDGAVSWQSHQNSAIFPGVCNVLDGNTYYNGAGTNAGFNEGGAKVNHQNWRSGGTSKQLPAGTSISPATGMTAWGDNIPVEMNYCYWGTHSLTDAVQIVHVPKGMPYVSETNGQELRLEIAISDEYNQSTTEDDVDFKLYFNDFAFYKTDIDDTEATNSHVGLSYEPTTVTATSITFRNSGFYEVTVPSTYWSAGASAGAKIIVSLNAEYLRSLLRRRNGDVTSGTNRYANAHNPFAENIGGTAVHAYAGVGTDPSIHPDSTATVFRADSPFPLGTRRYWELPTAFLRSYYYAPRLMVVDDMNYYPGTVIDYSDDRLNLTNEKLKIKRVRWELNNRDLDMVELDLERDESKAISGLSNWILPNVSKTRTGSNEGQGEGQDSDSDGQGDGYTPPFPGNDGWPGKPGEFGKPVRPGETGFDGSLEWGGNIVGGGVYDGVGPGGGTLNSNIAGIMKGREPAGVKNLTANALNRIKGKHGFKGESGFADGEFSMVGQENSGITTTKNTPIDGIGDFEGVGEGFCIVGEDGVVFPGTTTTGEASNLAKSTYEIQVRVPDNCVGKQVRIEAVMSLDGTRVEAANVEGTSASGSTFQQAHLQTSVECLQESSSKKEQHRLVKDNTSYRTEQLFSSSVSGAQTKGNTIRIRISRKPGADGQYNDNAVNAALVIHSINVSFTRAVNHGQSKQIEVTGLRGSAQRGGKYSSKKSSGSNSS